MASCDKYVSLVRSCYTTKMRFFKDDVSKETPIVWCFTAPNAQWCGMPNIFNSRNWYLGEPTWPELGEVQGAARTWSDGTGCCNPAVGVVGTADQWENGALFAEHLTEPPCAGPEVLGFPLETFNVVVQGNFCIGVYDPVADVWSADLAPIGVTGYFWTLFPVKGGACCFARAAQQAITTGPPNYTVYSPSVVGEIDPVFDPTQSCSLMFYFWYAFGFSIPFNVTVSCDD